MLSLSLSLSLATAIAACLAWTEPALAQTQDPLIIHSDGSQTKPSPKTDANADAWPDDPFATLEDGDLWIASTAARTVAALRWTGSGDAQIGATEIGGVAELGGSGFQPVPGEPATPAVAAIDLELPRADGSTQRVLIRAPQSLAAKGEIAILLVGVAADLKSLPSPGGMSLDVDGPFQPTPLAGAPYLEISVLLSPDGGATFDELDPARLQDAPIYLRIENLDASLDLDFFPVLFEHPTYIASDPATGLSPQLEPGVWTPAPSMTLPYTSSGPGETSQAVYLEAELRSLSIFVLALDTTTPAEPDTPSGDPDETNDDPTTDGKPVILDSGDVPLDDTDTITLNGDTDTPSTDPDGGGPPALLLSPGQPVWVDFGQNGPEDCTQYNPFDTLLEGVYAAVANGSTTINIDRQTPMDRSGETGVYAPPGPILIRAVNGPVRIGATGRVLSISFTQWGAVFFTPVGSTVNGDLPYAVNPEYRIYNEGDVVTLNAYPATGLRFRGWWSPDTDFEEEVTPSDLFPSTQHRIIMNRDRFVWALFEPNTENYDLTDADGDGLAIYRETALGTSDTDADSDDDGLPDGWEANYGLDPLSGGGNEGPNGDPDADAVANLEEYFAGRSPIFDDIVPPPAVPSPPSGVLPVEPGGLNPDFDFVDFTSSDGLSVQQDASVAGSEIMLVPAGGFKKRAVWTTNKMPVADGFSTTFRFNLLQGAPDSDGVSFVIQNSTAFPTLSTGGDMGYHGIPKSLAIEFDAYFNPGYGDPNYDHISVHTTGPTQPNSADEDFSIARVLTPSLTTGECTVRIVYNPDGHTLKVYRGAQLALTLDNFDLDAALDLSGGNAYVGIVSTTGDPAATNGPTMLRSWSADFVTSRSAADLSILRVTVNRNDNGAAVNELDGGNSTSFEDFDGSFSEWGQPDAYPFQLEEQDLANPARGEYPRSFDVFFDQVARPIPDDNLPASFTINLHAFVEGGFTDTGGFQEYTMVWSRDPGSLQAGNLLQNGFDASLVFDAAHPPIPGLYKIKCEARFLESLAPPHRTAVAYILLPYAGPEISDWLIEEARQITSPGGVGDQWVAHVQAAANVFTIPNPFGPPIDFNLPLVHERAFISASNGFDYLDQMKFGTGPATPRFNFDDGQRESDSPFRNGDGWDDPSYATLQGRGASRIKITNALWALWGRSVGFSPPTLSLGAWAKNTTKLELYETPSTRWAYQLGFNLHDAVVLGLSNSEILNGLLTPEAARSIQTTGQLNDIRLWPRPDATAPPHTDLWYYDPQTEIAYNMLSDTTWDRPMIFLSPEELSLNPFD